MDYKKLMDMTGKVCIVTGGIRSREEGCREVFLDEINAEV